MLKYFLEFFLFDVIEIFENTILTDSGQEARGFSSDRLLGAKSRANLEQRNKFTLFNLSEVEFTNFLGSRVNLGFLKSRLESRFQEVVIHQFKAKNATWVVILAWVALFNNTD